MRLTSKLWLLAIVVLAASAITAPSAVAQEPLVQNPAGLTITSEPGSDPCSSVTPDPEPTSGTFETAGGCRVHFMGVGISLRVHVSGIEVVVATCHIEFDMRTAANGRGYLNHQEFMPGLPDPNSCPRRPCHYPATMAHPEPPVSWDGFHREARPWRFFVRENAVAPKETITFILCVETRHTADLEMNKQHCTFTLPFTETDGGVPTDHRYTISANDVRGAGSPLPNCEISGTIFTETMQFENDEMQQRTQVEINHT